MATEVTKLITVSLGKMHQSRQTKCGLNLRKSLLVASVLHKARDVYVSEIKNRKVDTKRVTEEPKSSPEPVRKRRFTSQRSMVESESSDVSSTESVDSTEECDSNNKRSKSTPIVSSTVGEESNQTNTVVNESQSSAADLADTILDKLASETNNSTTMSTAMDKENSPPSMIQTSGSNTESKPITTNNVRCLKRRYSCNDSTQQSGATDTKDEVTDSSIQQKRSKTDCNDSSTIVNTHDSQTQINCLVKIFSQSFPEFTTTTENHIVVTSDSLISSTSCDKPSELNKFAKHLRESIALTA